jgi:predicted dinucleotide-binding enzyme
MAKITIIGAGNMARGIATRWAGEENEIQVLAPTSEHAASLAEELGGGARAGGVNDTIEGDIVVLATPYDGALDFVPPGTRTPNPLICSGDCAWLAGQNHSGQ